MKAEHNSIISGSSMAVLLGLILFAGCWFLPVGLGAKLFLALIGAVSFILGLVASKG